MTLYLSLKLMVLMWWGINMSIWDDFQKFMGAKQQETQQVAAPQPTPTQPVAVQQPAKPDYYERLKMAESSGRADVKAKTSSAVGHHQFLERTWKDLTVKYKKNYTLEDRTDPNKSLEIAKLFTEENKASLKRALKREPTDTQLYAAHFLGTTGAKRFLMASPKKLAKDVVNKNQVAANKNIFYDKDGKPRTVAQVYGILQKKIGEE
jgi:hypothetical protein